MFFPISIIKLIYYIDCWKHDFDDREIKAKFFSLNVSCVVARASYDIFIALLVLQT